MFEKQPAKHMLAFFWLFSKTEEPNLPKLRKFRKLLKDIPIGIFFVVGFVQRQESSLTCSKGGRQPNPPLDLKTFDLGQNLKKVRVPLAFFQFLPKCKGPPLPFCKKKN